MSNPVPSDRRTRWSATGAALLLCAVTVALLTAPAFTRMRRTDLIVPGPGVSRVTALSAYSRALAGTPGDTAVYVLEGREPGGTVLVLGGTHGDEPAGYIAAVVLVERARVERGRLIVVPRANESGFTHNVPQEGHPQQFAVDTPGGPRRFTFGARATNPVHQWPDPQVYTLASGQALSGSETRNLNRAYPGRADGTLTERVAFAITTLIRTERVDLALDLHEASPEYPVVNTIVAHQRATDLAALANLGMQAAGVDIGLEASPEIAARPVAPGMGRHDAGAGGADGDDQPGAGAAARRDECRRSSSRGATASTSSPPSAAASRCHSTSKGWPLAARVGRHLTGVTAFVDALGQLAPASAVELSDVPTCDTHRSGWARRVPGGPGGKPMTMPTGLDRTGDPGVDAGLLRPPGRLAPLADRPRARRRRLGRRGVRGRLAAGAAPGRGRVLLPRPDPRHRDRDDLHAAPGRRRRAGRDWRIGRTRVRPSPGSCCCRS